MEEVVRGWGDRRDTVWTDGSYQEDGRVGAAAVSWEEARRYHPGLNKEVFDAELCALYQASSRPTLHHFFGL